MRYVSTRGVAPAQPFSAILLEGLAPDGGLYVPETWPSVDIASLRKSSYSGIAKAILGAFMDDIPQLGELVEQTYSARIFGSDAITPLKTLEPGLHLLRLSNGPTAAFKDIALQLLGNLFESVLAKNHASLNILGAT